MTRLLSLNLTPVENTVRWYLDSYCSLFSEIAALCGTEDFRRLDMALFSYGGRNLPSRNETHAGARDSAQAAADPEITPMDCVVDPKQDGRATPLDRAR